MSPTDRINQDFEAAFARGRFYTCSKHGWDCLGKPCPKCTGGDAPRICAKHGWAHATNGCPDCTKGQP